MTRCRRPKHRIYVRNFDDAGLAAYLRSIQKFPALDRDGELELARRYQAGDRDAGHRLVEANLRHVAKIAMQYRGYGLRVADLIEEGNVGLLEAVKRFDPSRNLRFMTYAAYWVRACILSHVLKHWSIVGVGTGPLQSKLFFRLQRERARLAGTGTETDVDGALAATFHTSEDRIRDMTGRLDQRDTSLDAQAYRDADATMLDFMADEARTQEDLFADAEKSASVRNAIARIPLDDRERTILDERLLADDEATLADLGRKMGLSRERVRQLEERVVRKLRMALAA